jgi:transposase InsO family protein
VLEIRTSLPRLGTRKLHYLLEEKLAEHQITIGRDKLFDMLKAHRLLVKNRRRTTSTTNSHHWLYKYKNLVKEIEIDRPNQLWVSDITYIRLLGKFGYLSLITDAYSRKIMGYSFWEDLSAEGCLEALKMALKERGDQQMQLIHHSDRGIQYCSKEYVKMLTAANINISMTENGDPYENALAERVNGILKTEFQLYSSNVGFRQTGEMIDKSIYAYNHERPHASCNYLTPVKAHLRTGKLTKRWKSYRQNNGKQKMDIFESKMPV